jgi:hypothetical protein
MLAGTARSDLELRQAGKSPGREPQGGSEMVIQMSCPWCQEELLVEDSALQGDIRCDECAVAFSFASEAQVEVAVAA